MRRANGKPVPSTSATALVAGPLGGEAPWCSAWLGGRAIVEPLSMLCVLIGILIIAVRAPMIFAPSATLRFFGRLISTDTGIRGIGLVISPLALALVVLARGEGLGAGILQALGWVFAAATLWLLAAPDSYRRLARGVLAVFDDPAIVRIAGLVSVAFGITMIYVGLYVV